MGRAPCCDKANVKKGPWSPEEDAKLKTYIDQHGTGGNWIALPQKIGLKRCGKSCRLRWLNYLRPNIKHGGFSEEEDNIICSLYISIGSRWSIIAAQLPGRTDNDIKNYWNTRLKKKLLGKQRKEKNGSGKETSKGKQKYSGVTTDGLSYQRVVAPPPLPVLQPIPYSDDEPRFNNHASIRRLLIKLGGKFSTENQENVDNLIKPNHDHYQAGVDHDQALVQPVYNNIPIDHLIPSSDQISLLNSTPLPTLNSPHFDLIGTDHHIMSGIVPRTSVSFSAELERVIMYENPQRLQGLDFFYDDMMNRANCGESVDWGEMNPNWVFAASASNSNQGFGQESILEEIAVDKVRYTMEHNSDVNVGK
ncbi:hypothetical protein C2S51_037156 [Perilla frutescens var. frutescens]|nr:hypothetical protein C2S51_037156 [Perilla frutescens var. frutescens]